jgi:hypothetical protein
VRRPASRRGLLVSKWRRAPAYVWCPGCPAWRVPPTPVRGLRRSGGSTRREPQAVRIVRRLDRRLDHAGSLRVGTQGAAQQARNGGGDPPASQRNPHPVQPARPNGSAPPPAQGPPSTGPRRPPGARPLPRSASSAWALSAVVPAVGLGVARVAARVHDRRGIAGRLPQARFRGPVRGDWSRPSGPHRQEAGPLPGPRGRSTGSRPRPGPGPPHARCPSTYPASAGPQCRSGPWREGLATSSHACAVMVAQGGGVALAVRRRCVAAGRMGNLSMAVRLRTACARRDEAAARRRLTPSG